MKKLIKQLRRFLYVYKRVDAEIKAESNKKDGYRFITNFGKEDEAFYKKTHEKLGSDFRIDNSATDCNGRPLGNDYRALYVRGLYDSSKFQKIYHQYYIKQSAHKRKQYHNPTYFQHLKQNWTAASGYLKDFWELFVHGLIPSVKKEY